MSVEGEVDKEDKTEVGGEHKGVWRKAKPVEVLSKCQMSSPARQMPKRLSSLYPQMKSCRAERPAGVVCIGYR